MRTTITGCRQREPDRPITAGRLLSAVVDLMQFVALMQHLHCDKTVGRIDTLQRGRMR